MKTLTKISAAFFFCLYSLILLHNSLPHSHSDDHLDVHADATHAEAGHHHSDHHHHHHHPHDEGSDSHGLLDLLLDFLAGIDHATEDGANDDWAILDEVTLQKNSTDFSSGPGFVAPENAIVPVDLKGGLSFVEPPPDFYRPPARTTFPNRGPPNLFLA